MSKKRLENKKKMVERYREMNKFRYSIFSITNSAIPTEVKNNPILAGIVLEKLKELKEQMQEDIKNITIDKINIEDVLENRTSEVSEILATEICLFELPNIKNQYENYLKAQQLNAIFPLQDRKNRVVELEKEINNIELTIESLEKINPKLVMTQRERVQALEKEKLALEETLNFTSLEDIKAGLFVRLHSYLSNILNDFEVKIDFIERNM